MTDSLFWYKLVFMGELLVAEGLFTWKLRRRRFFRRAEAEKYARKQKRRNSFCNSHTFTNFPKNTGSEPFPPGYNEARSEIFKSIGRSSGGKTGTFCTFPLDFPEKKVSLSSEASFFSEFRRSGCGDGVQFTRVDS